MGTHLYNIYYKILSYLMAKKDTKMSFWVVYCKSRKKFDKYAKINRVRGKYVLDVKKIIQEEEIDATDKTYLKIIIFNKILQAVEKGRDIYYLPNFDDEFSIDKLLNLKKILGENDFNIIVFHDDFTKQPEYLEQAFDNLSKFTCSQIIRDY